MQIGNDELDHVFTEAIVPAISACGLDARRVDKHTEGRLLKSEIVTFLRTAEIILGDLTNERPNCYVEVGYAMGLGRYARLILMARGDHNPDSPNYSAGGRKVHFDLSGYDILWWDRNDLPGLRKELARRITARRRLPDGIAAPLSALDRSWVAQQRQSSIQLARIEPALVGLVEITFALEEPNDRRWNQKELLNAARAAQITRPGWHSLGLILDRENDRPAPVQGGIAAGIGHPSSTSQHPYFQYWALRDNGDFYAAASLFEDGRQLREQIERRVSANDPRRFYFELEIGRIAEAFLYAVRLYESLEVSEDVGVDFQFTHAGLANRELLDGSGRIAGLLPSGAISTEDDFEATVSVTLAEVESRLAELVREVVDRLFILFNFAQIHQDQVTYLVQRFQDGRGL